jgi:pSer/pThr/pTyr-binding forkhead associated (FHA) protein
MDKIHIRIGSASDNQLVIESKDIDAYHLELFSDPDGNVFITDLNTVNGTYVNGRLLEGFTLLTVGDKVVLGQHHLFRWESYIQKKTSGKNSSEEPKKEPIQTEYPIQSKNLNKQIIIIYSLIALVLLCMAFLMN